MNSTILYMGGSSRGLLPCTECTLSVPSTRVLFVCPCAAAARSILGATWIPVTIQWKPRNVMADLLVNGRGTLSIRGGTQSQLKSNPTSSLSYSTYSTNTLAKDQQCIRLTDTCMADIKLFSLSRHSTYPFPEGYPRLPGFFARQLAASDA